MTLDEYQVAAESTAIYPPEDEIIYPTLGLGGEAGEIQNKVKKVLRDDGGVFSNAVRDDLKKELGDVLWYVAILARDAGSSLEEIAQLNIAKLRDRQSRGVLGGSGDAR